MDEQTKKILIAVVAVVAVIAVGFEAIGFFRGDQMHPVGQGPVIAPGHSMKQLEKQSQASGKVGVNTNINTQLGNVAGDDVPPPPGH